MTDARDQDNTRARRRFDGMTNAELAVFAYETLKNDTMLDGDDGNTLAHAVVDRGVLSDDRDEAVARAGRLAESLDWIESEIGEGDGRITRDEVRKIIMKARAALAADGSGDK